MELIGLTSLRIKKIKMSSKYQFKLFAHKSFLYSAILHFIILNLFVLNVPLIKAPHKPFIVFLGALFQDTEVSGISSSQNFHSAVMRSAEIPYVSRAPYDDRSASKPMETGIIQKQPKITPKIFKTSEEGKKTLNPSELEELNLPVTPAYKPLRFQME